MTPQSKKLLALETLIGGITNALFNGLIAWLMLRGAANRTWGGDTSFAIDIIATAFILPFIVAWIVIRLQRSKLSKATLAPLDLGNTSALAAFATRMPWPPLPCALCFGLIGAIVIAPPTLLFLYVVGVQEMAWQSYTIFKGIWAGLLAAALIPAIVACAHRPTSRAPSAQTPL